MLHQQYGMLKQLSSLPRKIVSLHGADKVAEFVLHELCQTDCFNLTRAAYFIDNPDFDCFKGVSGLCRTEIKDDYAITWSNPEQFLSYTFDLPFNKKVRQVAQQSYRRQQMRDQEMANALATNLGFNNHAFCSWDMKHDNHGLFIYEKADLTSYPIEEHLMDGLCLLSFCPVA